MGVSRHLGIKLEEYDSRIRTFIPDYEEMLEVAATAVEPGVRTILDLGIGTGALAERCLRRAPKARVIGIDVDQEIVGLAERRLGKRVTLIHGTFVRTPLPACDTAVASFALHHIRSRTAKARFYRRVRGALRQRGKFVTVDCHPAMDRPLARQQHEQWRSHLMKSYPGREAAAYLAAWAKEDVYVPLESEMNLLEDSGFVVEVLWRKGAFAVLLGKGA